MLLVANVLGLSPSHDLLYHAANNYDYEQHEKSPDNRGS